ncbi:MAG: hypothetical protein L0Y44_16685 [Phycisphaerales bacterium]|nr:hypothetical protein [Phycisphaerales bacterium]MCI0632281.1 hypothetical protein [Phycisphaerales bacterium]
MTSNRGAVTRLRLIQQISIDSIEAEVEQVRWDKSRQMRSDGCAPV